MKKTRPESPNRRIAARPVSGTEPNTGLQVSNRRLLGYQAVRIDGVSAIPRSMLNGIDYGIFPLPDRVLESLEAIAAFDD